MTRLVNNNCVLPMIICSSLFVSLELLLVTAVVSHEITAIEKSPNGFYVATSEQNYAFTHPELSEMSWSSVSVRGDQVFIVRKDNTSSMERLDRMDDKDRDFISDLRSDFIANLASLTLTYLPPTTINKGNPKSRYGSKQLASRHSGGGGGASCYHCKPTMKRGPSYSSSSSSSSAKQSRPLLSNTYLPYKRPHPSQQRHKPQVAYRGGGGGGGGGISSSTSSGKGYGKMAKAKKYPAAAGASNNNNNNNYNYDVDGDEAANYYEGRQPKLSSIPSGFNYYNVHQSELGKRLTGDVYHFDVNGNILDVFSSSISVLRPDKSPQRQPSILYRDDRFFSYSSNLFSATILRLFVQGEFIFFVRKDSTVLVKPAHLLNLKERKLLAKARVQVERLCQWRNSPTGFIFNPSGAGNSTEHETGSSTERPAYAQQSSSLESNQ